MYVSLEASLPTLHILVAIRFAILYRCEDPYLNNARSTVWGSLPGL